MFIEVCLKSIESNALFNSCSVTCPSHMLRSDGDNIGVFICQNACWLIGLDEYKFLQNLGVSLIMSLCSVLVSKLSYVNCLLCLVSSFERVEIAHTLFALFCVFNLCPYFQSIQILLMELLQFCFCLKVGFNIMISAICDVIL